MAGTPIEIIHGAARTLRYKLVDHENGAIVTLSGRYLEIVVVCRKGSEEELLRKRSNVSGEGLVVDVAKGIVELYILSPDTEAMGPGSYRYDLWLVEDDDHRYPAFGYIGVPFIITARAAPTV